jgi:hypothetical protein
MAIAQSVTNEQVLSKVGKRVFDPLQLTSSQLPPSQLPPSLTSDR